MRFHVTKSGNTEDKKNAIQEKIVNKEMITNAFLCLDPGINFLVLLGCLKIVKTYITNKILAIPSPKSVLTDGDILILVMLANHSGKPKNKSKFYKKRKE